MFSCVRMERKKLSVYHLVASCQNSALFIFFTLVEIPQNISVSQTILGAIQMNYRKTCGGGLYILGTLFFNGFLQYNIWINTSGDITILLFTYLPTQVTLLFYFYYKSFWYNNHKIDVIDFVPIWLSIAFRYSDRKFLDSVFSRHILRPPRRVIDENRIILYILSRYSNILYNIERTFNLLGI